jgi:hypothetical protein
LNPCSSRKGRRHSGEAQKPRPTGEASLPEDRGFAREGPGTRALPTLAEIPRSRSVGNRVNAPEELAAPAALRALACPPTPASTIHFFFRTYVMSAATKRAAHYRYLERECRRLADIEDSTDISTASRRAANYRYLERECRRLAEIEDSTDIRISADGQSTTARGLTPRSRTNGG